MEVSGNEGQRRLEKRLGHLHAHTHCAFDFVTAGFEIPFRVLQKENRWQRSGFEQEQRKRKQPGYKEQS
jgi:hypothetical protein